MLTYISMRTQSLRSRSFCPWPFSCSKRTVWMRIFHSYFSSNACLMYLNIEHRNLAMLFIAQGTATDILEAVFRYPRNRQLVIGCIKGSQFSLIRVIFRHALIIIIILVIDSVPENAYEPELLEDLRRLRHYLISALADPIASPKLF